MQWSRGHHYTIKHVLDFNIEQYEWYEGSYNINAIMKKLNNIFYFELITVQCEKKISY